MRSGRRAERSVVDAAIASITGVLPENSAARQTAVTVRSSGSCPDSAAMTSHT
jgi:hypothetical protein